MEAIWDAVTYEDAPLAYRGDLIDVTSPRYKPKTPDDRAYNPRGGPLNLSFAVSVADERPANVTQLIDNLLDTYRYDGYPGVYVFNQSANGVVNIVPKLVRDKTGALVGVTPIMDTIVTLSPRMARTNKDIVELIRSSIKKETGVTVVLGRPLEPSFEAASFSEDVSKSSARDLLERSMKKAGGHRLWMLLWEPARRYYVLSIF